MSITGTGVAEGVVVGDGSAIARLELKVAICDTGHKFAVTRRHAVNFAPNARKAVEK